MQFYGQVVRFYSALGRFLISYFNFLPQTTIPAPPTTPFEARWSILSVPGDNDR